jgi:hypothetical protein
MGRIHWVSNARSQEILKDGLWNSTWSGGEWSEPKQIFSETTDNTRLAATTSGRLVAAFRQTTTNVNWDAVFAMNTASKTFYFPHYADFGGEPGVSMLFAINNLSSGQASGKLVVYANDGQLQNLNFEGIGLRSELDLSIEPNSTAVFSTIGDPVLLKTGYISVELDQPDVSGVAIFRYAAGPEASVLPAEPGRRFALYVEKSAALSTGIAFARLTPEQPLTLRLYELDGSLREEVTDYTMSGPQEAKFVEQFFTDVPDEFTGLMVVESEALLTCVGLRFGGGILSTIPVSDLDAVGAQPTFFFPHYGDGSGLSTSFVINNLLSESVAGQISFFDPAGNPQQMPLEAEPPANQITLDLDAKASRVLKTDGSTPGNPLVGYSAVELDEPGASGVAIFKYASGPEASVLPSYPGKKFSLFVEVSAALDTGFAIARSAPDDVVLRLYDKSGVLIGTESAPFEVNNLHLARFLSQIFTVPLGFQGLLVMESEGDFSTIGLRFGGGILSTIPVTPLQAAE